MSKHQTENSNLEKKVILRIKNLPNKSEINILDCFSADGLIWDIIKKRTDKKLNVTRIEIKSEKKGAYLKGDNIKFLSGMNLKKFDVIDIDAFGSPFNQIEILHQKKYKGIVFATFIQSYSGALNKKMLIKLGYSKEMQAKVKILFYKNGMEKFKSYLSLIGIKKINGYFIGKKNYFCMKMED